MPATNHPKFTGARDSREAEVTAGASPVLARKAGVWSNFAGVSVFQSAMRFFQSSILVLALSVLATGACGASESDKDRPSGDASASDGQATDVVCSAGCPESVPTQGEACPCLESANLTCYFFDCAQRSQQVATCDATASWKVFPPYLDVPCPDAGN
jgi:hypothetical protein